MDNMIREELAAKFHEYDKDDGGSIDKVEFAAALRGLQFYYNTDLVSGILQLMYGNDPEWEQRQHALHKEHFIDFVENFLVFDEEIRETICGMIQKQVGEKISPNEVDILQMFMLEVRLDNNMELDYTNVKTKIAKELAGEDTAENRDIQAPVELDEEKRSSVVISTVNFPQPSVVVDEEIMDPTTAIPSLLTPSVSVQEPLSPLPEKLENFVTDNEKLEKEVLKGIVQSEKERKREIVFRQLQLCDDDDSQQECQEIWNEILSFFDHDSDGTIKITELVEALQASGIHTNEEEVQELASSMDVDHDGDIEWEEFEIFYKKFSSDIFSRGMQPEEIQNIFVEYDTDFSGFLAMQEVLQILHRLCPTMNDEECQYIFHTMDKSGDGQICCAEFEAFLFADTKMSNRILRKMIRARNPSPLQRLLAFANMPKHFRPSLLSELASQDEQRLSHLLRPKLDQSGLLFTNVKINIDDQRLRSLGVDQDLCVFEFLRCDGIPSPPEDIRHRILSRRVRVCLYCQDNTLSVAPVAVSNIWTLPVMWNEFMEDVWILGKKAMPHSHADSSGANWNKIAVKIPQDGKRYQLIIECNIVVEPDPAEGKFNRASDLLFDVPLSEVKELCQSKDGKGFYVASEPYVGAILVSIDGMNLAEKNLEEISSLPPNTKLSLQHPPGKMVEMCCAWASYIVNRNVIDAQEKIVLNGGMVGSKMRIDPSDIASKRTGFNIGRLMRVTGLDRAPRSATISIKTSRPNKRLFRESASLPHNILLATPAIPSAVMYFDLLADFTLRTTMPYHFAASRSAIDLRIFLRCADIPPLFAFLADSWRATLHELPKKTLHALKKERFHSFLMRTMIPLAYGVTNVSDVISEKNLSELQKCRDEGPQALLGREEFAPLHTRDLQIPTCNF